MFGASRLDFKKSSVSMMNINPDSKNITHILSMLKISRRCLIIISSKNETLLENFLTIKRHLVLVTKLPCNDIPASAFDSEIYCLENGVISEKYRIRDKIVTRMLADKTLKKLSEEKLSRRSNLQGVEIKVTASHAAHRMKIIKYGNASESKISGIFGDLFNIISKISIFCVIMTFRNFVFKMLN